MNLVRTGNAPLLLTLAVLALAVRAEGTNVTLRVMSPHAMSYGLRIVGEYYDKSVNTETPGYYDDLSRSEPTAPGRARMAKACMLEACFASTGTVREAIEAVLAANKRVDPSVSYCVVTNQPWPDVYTVVPEHWQGGAGVQNGIPSIFATRVTIGVDSQESLIGHLKKALLAVSPYDDEMWMRGVRNVSSWESVNSRRAFTNEMAMAVMNMLFCDPYGKERGSWHCLRLPRITDKRMSLLDVKYAPRSDAREKDRFVVSFNERPLANIVMAVSHDIRKLVGYEDPDLSGSCYSGIDGVPYRTTCSYKEFKYLSLWSHKEILDRLVQSVMVEEYTFRVEGKAGAFCVLPDRADTFGGTIAYKECHPVSTNIVRIATGDTNACAVVTEICRQLGEASGKMVVLSKDAKEILMSKSAPLDAQGLPGWLALSIYLQGVSQSLSWRLLHKPAKDRYVLDIYDWSTPVVIMGGDPNQPPE